MDNGPYKLGNGERIKVWEERWIMDKPLAMYPWIMDCNLINGVRMVDVAYEGGLS